MKLLGMTRQTMHGSLDSFLFAIGDLGNISWRKPKEQLHQLWQVLVAEAFLDKARESRRVTCSLVLKGYWAV